MNDMVACGECLHAIIVNTDFHKNNFLGDVSLVICRQNIFSKIIVAITIISI